MRVSADLVRRGWILAFGLGLSLVVIVPARADMAPEPERPGWDEHPPPPPPPPPEPELAMLAASLIVLVGGAVLLAHTRRWPGSGGAPSW